MKPKGFLTVTLLLGLFSFSPVLWFGSYYAGPLWDIFWTALFVEIGLVVTIFFWLRFNWARLIIQLGYFVNGAALVDYLRSDTQQPVSSLQWNVWIAQVLFGVFLFYWLNTNKVRTHFRARKADDTLSQPVFDGKPPIPEP